MEKGPTIKGKGKNSTVPHLRSAQLPVGREKPHVKKERHRRRD